MRISLRLIVSITIGITLISFAFAEAQVQAQKRSLRDELVRRAHLLADSLKESVEPLLQQGSPQKLTGLVERFGNRERLAGVAIYETSGAPLAITSGLRERLAQPPQAVAQALGEHRDQGEFFRLGESPMHVEALPLEREGQTVGALAIFHDAGYIETQSARIWRTTFRAVAVQALVISLVILLIVRWSIVGPIARVAERLRELRRGGASRPLNPEEAELFTPLMHEVTHLTSSLASARAAAEGEARLREASESVWTPERLRVHVQNRLRDSRLVVVSNREPYMHVRRGKSIEVMVPASGLVTALEPVLRSCDGTWVAHGSGDADPETVDRHDRLRVPPDEEHYTLRRVWLSKEEEDGYYYGFANEGLWPLCHISHTRPTFRAADWEHYRQANQKFARVVLEEIDCLDAPVVLIQDYHFALLPALVKRERPDARVAIFWHIPWPNPEAFAICPWQGELLEGLLGADLIGFHIQAHCNNFLQTVNTLLESRVEWEQFAVDRNDHRTLVKPFPISVDFEESFTEPEPPEFPYAERSALFREMGVEGTLLGVGVDRVDYTKGIQERFLGIERFLEKYPSFREKFVFAQLGAPSRTKIPRYQDLVREVEAEAERINRRFQTGRWKPIVFLLGHHNHLEIGRYYRACDVCLVTSLHDGMNLVAKEFVAARRDEQGVLILSQFTGAARQLREAVLVNPYDVEQIARALRLALEMDPEDVSSRMRRMRRQVREQNIYYWAGSLIAELTEIPLPAGRALAVGAPAGSLPRA